MQQIICTFDQFIIYNWKGEHLLTQDLPGVAEGARYMGKRCEILRVLCKHLQDLGIPLRRGKRITEYFETDTEAGKGKKDESYAQLPAPAWSFSHDSQAYAYEEFETAARAVETGGPYTPRNVPAPDTSAAHMIGSKVENRSTYRLLLQLAPKGEVLSLDRCRLGIDHY